MLLSHHMPWSGTVVAQHHHPTVTIALRNLPLLLQPTSLRKHYLPAVLQKKKKNHSMHDHRSTTKWNDGCKRQWTESDHMSLHLIWFFPQMHYAEHRTCQLLEITPPVFVTEQMVLEDHTLGCNFRNKCKYSSIVL